MHRVVFLIILLILSFACRQSQKASKVDFTSLEEESQKKWENALLAMTTAKGLEVELFAHEPMLINPTNIAVDDRGRVWVTQARNYRLKFNPEFEKVEEGDQILILEDTDGDGKADQKKVFYQGPDLLAPLGMSVFGNKVIVSCSPQVLLFEDRDGDDIADFKDTIFSGISAVDDDHGIHAFNFGPDGHFYFNFGNNSKQIKTKTGEDILDQEGRVLQTGGDPYWQALVMRSNQTFDEVEVLAHNFRNPFEVTTDPFGSIWQSDNDDDGNKGVRILQVMEYGNYGYKDEITGAGWQEKRLGMHQEIPKRHWHQNDPGVAPVMLYTGAGSPAGICFYGGELLPEVFQNQLIHAEALHNVVRAYPVEKEGAAYRASIVDILKSKDHWFRPSDVAVAPDGSIFISDWYDAGVGGNNMDDIERGRIYRVAPQKVINTYTIPQINFDNYDQSLKTFKNPNQSVQYLTWQHYIQKGIEAEAELSQMWKEEEPELKARAIQLLARIPGKSDQYILAALEHENEDIRMVGVRMAKELEFENLGHYLQKVVQDPSDLVRREVAIALRYVDSQETADLWANLVDQYQPGDRWMLEALGIGADKHVDNFFQNYLHKGSADHGKIVELAWRLNAEGSTDILLEEIKNENITDEALQKYFRAFHFKSDPQINHKLIGLLDLEHPLQNNICRYVIATIDQKFVENHSGIKSKIIKLLPDLNGTEEWLDAVQMLDDKSYVDDIYKYFTNTSDQQEQRDAAALLINLGAIDYLKEKILRAGTEEKSKILESISNINHQGLATALVGMLNDEELSFAMKSQIVESLGSNWDGQHILYDHLKEGSIQDQNLVNTAALKLMSCWDPEVRFNASKYLSTAKSKTGYLPDINELVDHHGNEVQGKEVFQTYCATCHQVNGEGVTFGPDLSLIGEKLAKRALYSSIIYPSAGINFGYEGVLIQTKGGYYNGYIISRTDDYIKLKLVGGLEQDIPKGDIIKMDAMETSLMTEGLHEVMEEQDLVNLVEYLSSLQNPT